MIYTSQLAGRLNWTSMAPEHIRKSDPAISRRTRPVAADGNTPGTNPSAASNAFVYVPDLELDDQVIHCWAGISNLMHLGNEKLFRSRQHTTNIIQTGKYVELMQEFQPLLQDWDREFQRFRLPPFTRHILTIEYEYVRIYVNSLSLQAVVERCSNAGQMAHSSNPNGHHGNGTQLSPQTLINFGKLPLGQLGGFTAHDQEYVREVVDGSRNLLRTVVDGLLPGDYLKHAPVRTYFRIISGAMFLLKTFALGAPRSDVKMSIDLMDATVDGLRTCVVDDVHLGIRFADLLETLTSRLRNRFIQAPTMQQASGSAQSPAPEALANGSARPNGDGGNGWMGGHAQKLRDGLDGQCKCISAVCVHDLKLTCALVRAATPSVEPNNISATPFDLSTGNFPYPSAASIGPSTPAPETNNNAANSNNNNNNNPGMDVNIFDDWNNPGNEMWYLPTGPAFFQNMENSAVAMTAEGVNVGGLDLLEYMAMDPVQFSGVEGQQGSGGVGGGTAGGSGSGI
jgi:hypothetical protein